MLISLFVATMSIFAFLTVGALATLALYTLKLLIEWIDRITWNYMFQREIKKWRKKNEKH